MTRTPAQEELLRRARLLLTWYEDLESEDSEATAYASWLTLRVILQHLSPTDRKEFITLLDKNTNAAKAFAEARISDMETIIATELAKGLEKAMQRKEHA